MLHPLFGAHNNYLNRLEEERPLLFLGTLVTASSPSAPSSVLRQLTTLLIHESLSDASSSLKSRARAFLLSLRQRHPSAFESAVQNVIEDDEAVKDDIERLLVELSVVSFPFDVDQVQI